MNYKICSVNGKRSDNSALNRWIKGPCLTLSPTFQLNGTTLNAPPFFIHVFKIQYSITTSSVFFFYRFSLKQKKKKRKEKKKKYVKKYGEILENTCEFRVLAQVLQYFRFQLTVLLPHISKWELMPVWNTCHGRWWTEREGEREREQSKYRFNQIWKGSQWKRQHSIIQFINMQCNARHFLPFRVLASSCWRRKNRIINQESIICFVSIFLQIVLIEFHLALPT